MPPRSDVVERHYRRCVCSGCWPVSPATGRLLYMLGVEAARACRGIFVEAGTGLGFSALWLASAILDAGVYSYLLTIDLVGERSAAAWRLLKEEGLGLYVDPVVSEASMFLRSMRRVPVCMAFLDAAKEMYGEYLDALESLMADHSILAAHNVTAPSPWRVSGFLEAVSRRYTCVILHTDYAGLLAALVLHHHSSSTSSSSLSSSTGRPS